MANKRIKELKKGDKIRSSVSDGRKVYLTWCTISDVRATTIYDINGVKRNGGRVEIKALSYTADAGSLKGSQYEAYLDEEGIVIVPDRPPRWRRILREIFSS